MVCVCVAWRPSSMISMMRNPTQSNACLADLPQAFKLPCELPLSVGLEAIPLHPSTLTHPQSGYRDPKLSGSLIEPSAQPQNPADQD